ncbi:MULTISPECIES: GNAT family N-acetyltransferase [Streptomyces]|uniref:GNAT family N-acetyltransferase n=1 Tax=Streptomyces TaxID=1883 RepID=UPI0004C7C485|nr:MULTISPECIES: GNAT family N-acetyltransferase [unclassified Streptomyces]
MATERDGLPEEGLALWLTEWKHESGFPWPGRHLVVSVGGVAAGQLDFFLHPDRQAVKVTMLRVHPDFQRRGLAGVMMDALYAAYPTAWINHGWRTKEGALWWDGYRDPAPHRNVHNRPPAEWAAYFDAVEVAGEMAQNAHQHSFYGLHGHRDAVYRYGERLETEAALHAGALRPVVPVRVDPAMQPLHGVLRLVLPPAVHGYVHDPAQDPAVRAAALLEHIGHGNLPREAYWNSTRHAAFAEAHHEELFVRVPPERPATHVVFTLAPSDIAARPGVRALETSVDVRRHFGDIAVEVAALSWRRADRPHMTHSAEFEPAVQAAVAPWSPQEAGEGYRGRYDEEGFLRAAVRGNTRPFADRAAQIQAMAERLLRHRPAPPTPPAQAAPRRPDVQQPQPPQPQQHRQGPGRRG